MRTRGSWRQRTASTRPPPSSGVLGAWAKWEDANLPAVKEPKPKDAPINTETIEELLKPNMAEVVTKLPAEPSHSDETGGEPDATWREKLELVRAVEVEGRDRKGVIEPIDRRLEGPFSHDY